MTPLQAFEGFLATELTAHLWPFFRVAGMLMVTPVFGSRLVPIRVRVILALGVTFVLVPVLPAYSVIEPGLMSGLLVAQEILLGVAMGFTLQMIFDALVIAGQTIAMTMGLGFAMMVDPHRGVSVPVLSQFFIIMGILIFLSLGGHLASLAMLAESFRLLPIGEPLSQASMWALLSWGSEMFGGAVRIALPAVAAILIVNIGFGVMSRAAPTLNLFAVGFPSALLLGFLIILVNVRNLDGIFSELLEAAFLNIGAMLAP